jgi:hypothetical protein
MSERSTVLILAGGLSIVHGMVGMGGAVMTLASLCG